MRTPRWMLSLTGLTAAFAIGAATASAHVVVIADNPTPPAAGGFEQYTMRVPCEKNNPTVKIVLKVPKGVSFVSYEPVPGWKVTENQVNGQTLVTWQATGGGIQPGQFEQFPFLATNPRQPGVIAWDAFQYYRDGSIVAWTGATGSATPHSTTQIVAAGTASEPPANAVQTAPGEESTSSANSFGLGWTTADTMVLASSVVSLLLAVISLVFSLRRDLNRS
ncbi:YcnI family protein [Alicyclobacillus acidocaldarius]|nr:YcnI family protein [Alicyclobacillus acidocaldarius]